MQKREQQKQELQQLADELDTFSAGLDDDEAAALKALQLGLLGMLDSDDEEGESEGEEAEGEGVDALLVAAPAAYGRTLGTLTLSRDAVHWGELGAERPSLSFPVSDVAKAAIQPKAPASPWVPARSLPPRSSC